MSMKEIKATIKRRKEVMFIIVPLVIASLVVILNLVPAEILGLFADAYTVTLLLMILIVTMFATRKRSKKVRN